MKNRNTATLLALLVPLAAAAAPTVTRDLGTNGNWKTAIVSGHDLWGKDACLASTVSKEGPSTLEIYAEKEDGQETFVEPTVQIVARNETGFVRAVATDEDRGAQIHLTLAANANEPASLGLLARIDDRSKLIAMIKKSNELRVQLINEKNKVTKTLRFSLKGSSKATDAAFAGCGLAVSTP